MNVLNFFYESCVLINILYTECSWIIFWIKFHSCNQNCHRVEQLKNFWALGNCCKYFSMVNIVSLALYTVSYFTMTPSRPSILPLFVWTGIFYFHDYTGIRTHVLGKAFTNNTAGHQKLEIMIVVKYRYIIIKASFLNLCTNKIACQKKLKICMITSEAVKF